MTTASEERYGTLVDYRTGEAIGPATREQAQASATASDSGVFLVDVAGTPRPQNSDPAVFGELRTVYVQE